MNLLSKLHKNSILTGPVESYCLACGCLLHSEEESYAHIHKQEHVEKLEAVPRLENYKDDCIIKIKDGYFCPYCNLILPTIKRVNLHVAEPNHGDSKNSQSITRHSGVIFAFDVVVIDDRSWNGLDGSTCFVCNEDYDDEEEHKKEATHVLNLIQAKCEFGGNFIYRKVDEELCFCLICNDVLPILKKPTHHESESHIKLYEKSKTEATSIRNNISIDNTNISVTELNNNTPALPEKPETSQNTNETIKNVDYNKPKVYQSNAQNDGAHIVVDNSIETTINTQESNLNIQVQETSKLNSEKTTQVLLNTENKRTQQIVKSNIATANLNVDKVKLNSEKEKLVAENAKLIAENAKLAEKLNTAKVKLIADKAEEINKSSSSTDSVTKSTEATISEAVIIETDKSKPNTATNKIKSENISEQYLYEYLKDRNYIITTVDGAICILCGINFNKIDAYIHSVDKHHCILSEKHAARHNNATFSENLKTVNGDSNKSVSKTSETNEGLNSSTVTGKENIVPVIEEYNNNAQRAPSKASNKPNQVIEQTKPDTENKDDKLNKEIYLENPPQNGSNENNQGVTITKTETTVPPKKITKKAQKKAAKAKAASEASRLPKETQEIGIATVSGAETDKITFKEDTTNKILASTALDDNSNKNLVNSNADTNKGLKVQLNDANSKTDLDKVVNSNEFNKDTENTLENETMARFATEADLKTDNLLNILKSVSQVDSSPDDVVINSKHVLGNLSFGLVVRSGLNAECAACEEKLSHDEIHKHIITEGHRSNVEDCLVVTSLGDEFIRLVKTQGYHCGYCNILVRSWVEMKAHLDSYRHDDAKTSAWWRLERYRPHLKHCQTKEVRSLLAAVFRCTRE